MSLFHFQYRRAKLEQGELPPLFPEVVTLEIRFGPPDAFGIPCERRTVAPRAQRAGMFLDLNEGTTYLNAELIAKTTGMKELGDLSATLDGNCLRLARRVDSTDEAIAFAASANQLLPPLLSLRLHTFVWVKEFCLLFGSGRIRFEVGEIRCTIPTATTEGNVERVWTCIHDWGKLAPEHLRVVGSLYYYRHALRLSHVQPDQVSSLAPEIVLNLVKALEIIFSDHRDSLREKARVLGFSDRVIEEVMIPLFLIRSNLDIAHVATGPDERQIVVNFTTRAVANVGRILAQVLQAALNRQLELDATSTTLDNDKRKLIQALERYNLATAGIESGEKL